MTERGSGEKLLVRDFVLVCVSNTLAFFSIYMVIPVLPVFLEDRGYNNALIGAIMSMATVAALLRPVLGRLADRRGRRLVLSAGALLLGASTFFYMAFASALPLFVIRFLNGLGLAAFHTAAYAMVGDLAPPSRRLQAIAIFYISVDVTIALAPLAAEAIERAWGFTPLYLAAAVIALLSLLSTLLVRESGEHEAGVAATAARARITPLQKAIYAATMGFTLTFGALQTFIVLSSREHGIDQGELFFTVFAATLIAFRLGVGKKADRLPLLGRHHPRGAGGHRLFRQPGFARPGQLRLCRGVRLPAHHPLRPPPRPHPSPLPWPRPGDLHGRVRHRHRPGGHRPGPPRRPLGIRGHVRRERIDRGVLPVLFLRAYRPGAFPGRGDDQRQGGSSFQALRPLPQGIRLSLCAAPRCGAVAQERGGPLYREAATAWPRGCGGEEGRRME